TVVRMPGPDLIVPAAEANRTFSKLLRAAREGRRILITSHGQPVAELTPASAAGRDEAIAEQEAHWASLKPKVVGPWTREELYERD
ncbi:MAG: type II toxin-antitoxin system Phd/YefM family antitoxin, partial [Caulobacteraceae bacterium]